MKKELFLYFLLVISFFSCESLDLTDYSEQIYVTNDGATQPAFIAGNVSSKKLIVILHGGPGGNGLEYRVGDYYKQLEENVGVVYYDQRGQGMSYGKYTEDDVTVEQLTADLYALVKVLKTKFGNDTKIFLLGHSWGGMLGTAYLMNETYQKEISGWIESNGAHDIPLLNTESVKLFKEVANEQIKAGNSVEDWQAILDWANEIDINNITEEVSGEINSKGFEVENYLRSDEVINYGGSYGEYIQLYLVGRLNPLTSHINGNRTYWLLNDEVESTAFTSQLYKIKVPSLFLYSKYDFVVPAALGVSAYQKVASNNKQFYLFEKSGHSPMDSEPNEFANQVIRFTNQF